MTTIVLVRHGETDWNAVNRCQGSCDVPMNERGREQVAALAEALRDASFDAAYSSPLGRARETAMAVIGSSLTLEENADLTELSYGSMQGSCVDEWPSELRTRWKQDPWSMTFPDGESLEDVRRRVSRAFAEIAMKHSGQRVLVSSHGHASRVLLIDALRLPRESFWKIAQPNACVYELTRRDGGNAWSATPEPLAAG